MLMKLLIACYQGLRHASIALQLEPGAEPSKKAGILFEIGNFLKELGRDQDAVQVSHDESQVHFIKKFPLKCPTELHYFLHH